MDPVSFVKDLSKKINKSKRAIQLYAQIGSKLTKEIKELIKGSSIEDNLTDLLILARTKDIDKQKELISKVKSGEYNTVRSALIHEKENKIDLDKPNVPISSYRKLLKTHGQLEIDYHKLLNDHQKLLNELNNFRTAQ